ncbi:MAG TPA: GGDEF domain-containing protein [Myxococcota bacterium]|nr:GGDEF domain-containing protein [Myxococcota bacterium]
MVDTKDIEQFTDGIVEEDAGDRTVIQGIKDLTGALSNRQAYLIVISGSAVGRMFKVTNKVRVGRAQDCEIFLDDDGISRIHAQLEQDEFGSVIIEDMDSTNGTYFNGTRINRHQLRDGDKIQIGSTTILKFSYQDSLEEAFHQHQYDSATKDGLTRIYNKKYFSEQIAKDFAYALRHNEITSLIMIDIDHFKQVNDEYGHQAGDFVLRELSTIVGDALRSEDLFARIGGEEFAIILREIDERRAHVLAERIRRTVEVHKFFWEGQRIRVTISLGVSTLASANFRSPAEMIRTADEYLYRAKNSGRNRVASSLR